MWSDLVGTAVHFETAFREELWYRQGAIRNKVQLPYICTANDGQTAVQPCLSLEVRLPGFAGRGST
jgi:hypothetical protein